MRQPTASNHAGEPRRLMMFSTRMASSSPSGEPNCGQLPIRPRRLSNCDHSVATATEPPHSPPTPIPCSMRRTTRMKPPQMPIEA